MGSCQMRLSGLRTGCSARVISVDECEIKPRLTGLGISAGAQVTRLFSAASGDPTAYLVRGSVVALRARDASKVVIGGNAWA